MKTLNKIFVLIFILFMSFTLTSCNEKENENYLDYYYSVAASKSGICELTFTHGDYIGSPSGLELLEIDKLDAAYNFGIDYYYKYVDDKKIDIIINIKQEYILFIYHYDEFTYSKYTYKYLSNCLYYETNNKDEANPNYFLFDDILYNFNKYYVTEFKISDLYLIIKCI